MNDLTITVAGAAPDDDALPVLHEEAPPMNLPSGASLLPDGTVRLDLEFPREVKYRAVGSGQVVRADSYDHLVFRRLVGRDVRKLLDRKNGTDMAISISAGLSPAKWGLLQQVMDAADIGAAQNVVNELLGDMARDGLPPHAEDNGTTVRLPLFFPVPDGEGEQHADLVFKRMTGGDRKAIAEANDTLTWSVHRSTGLTPKAAKELIDNMDGADVVAATKVVGFLSGNGRTGR